MPDNIRRFDELIRGVRRLPEYDLCPILSVGKVSYSKLCSSLGLQMLTDAYKKTRKAITIDLLHQNNPTIEGFL
jgi:hypothetical protein